MENDITISKATILAKLAPAPIKEFTTSVMLMMSIPRTTITSSTKYDLNNN